MITNQYVTVKVELVVRANELFRYGDIKKLEQAIIAKRNEGDVFGVLPSSPREEGEVEGADSGNKALSSL